jgi:outer membrane protein assembly factor BamB
MTFPKFLALVVVLGLATDSRADDWPQWMGAKRDDVWRETGIVQAFPQKGLPVKWRAPVGLGYSGPAVAGGKVYLLDYEQESGKVTNSPGGRDRLQGSERVLCLDANTGKLLWTHAYERPYNISYASGPRCTPTVEGGKVYTLGAEGNLLCLDADKGNVIWQKDLTKEYKFETPVWGFSAHPLVDGDLLYCVVGGQGSVAVAFDKNSGREVWRALSAPEPGYCPPMMIEHGGKKQLIIFHPEAVNSLDPMTGKVHWSVPIMPSYSMSIAPPRLLGDHLFTSAYNNAAVMLQLDATKPDPTVTWRGKVQMAVYCSNSPAFLMGNEIYGCDSQTGALMAVQIADGKRLWETVEPTSGKPRARYGTAYLVQHQDRFFLFNEQGDLILAQLSPAGYKELGRIHVLEPTNNTFGRPVVWSHPAFAMKCLFARNDRELVCVNLAAGE